MILFSTVLDVNDTFGIDDFIHILLEWNESSTHPENIVPNICWSGEHTIRYGTDNLSLEWLEYPEKRILAARHEKITEDGVVWDSDFVLDCTKHKISIQLDRTYSEEALVMDAAFSTPHFISILIQHGVLKDDGCLPVLRTPIYVTDEDIELCKAVLSNTNGLSLPVVFVSKSNDAKDPLDVAWLASRLKGAAHVLVEKNSEECAQIRTFCGKSEEPFGAVWIYYPSEAIRCKKYYYHSSSGNNEVRLEKVIRNIIQYSITQRTEHLLTWNGLNGAVLNDQLKKQISVYASVESARKKAEDEMEQIYETFDEELKSLQKKIEELTKANEALQYENQGLRAKFSNEDTVPLVYLGDEEDFYAGEIRDMILGTLEDALSATEKATRKSDVLEDILDNNTYYHLSDERKQRIKTLFKGYKNFTGAIRQELLSLGIEISDEGKHYKLTYHGDHRYMVTVAKTPSDSRSGSNSAAQINKTML